MTQLRQKMIRAMELKNLSHHTQRAYLAAVTGIARIYNQSPDKMTKEKIEDYLLYLKHDKGNAPNSCYSVLTGLRFFYKNVMEKEIPVTYSIRKTPRKLPEVLTMEDVWKIICSHEQSQTSSYSDDHLFGRTSGPVKSLTLKPEHIDSKRMLIKVEAAKVKRIAIPCFQKDFLSNCGPITGNTVPKPICSLRPLRKRKIRPLSYETIRSVYENARKKAGVKRGVGIHTLAPLHLPHIFWKPDTISEKYRF